MMRRIFLLAALMLVLTVGNAMADTKKVYSVASDCAWPPMEFLGDDKKPQGFSADLLAALGEELGVTFNQVNIAWDGIFSAVAAGKFDFIASSVTVTEERKKTFLFSDPYYQVVQAVVMLKGKSVKDLAELKGKKVGGQIGTTGIFVIDKAKVGAVIKEYEDVGLAMEELKSGRLDAVICDDNVASYYANVKKGFENTMHVVLKTTETEDLAFCLNKKDKDLCALLNDGLKRIKANGKYDAIVKKWGGN
ncbi:MAG: basic amino acid ABC transporter substrate-binding protein [Desulfovibrionaceae bacterium]|nr:basic amino acid ABC transporter substrate-binding protein [Desulfovibrionaceae bacterium]